MIDDGMGVTRDWVSEGYGRPFGFKVTACYAPENKMPLGTSNGFSAEGYYADTFLVPWGKNFETRKLAQIDAMWRTMRFYNRSRVGEKFPRYILCYTNQHDPVWRYPLAKVHAVNIMMADSKNAGTHEGHRMQRLMRGNVVLGVDNYYILE